VSAAPARHGQDAATVQVRLLGAHAGVTALAALLVGLDWDGLIELTQVSEPRASRREPGERVYATVRLPEPGPVLDRACRAGQHTACHSVPPGVKFGDPAAAGAPCTCGCHRECGPEGCERGCRCSYCADGEDQGDEGGMSEYQHAPGSLMDAAEATTTARAKEETR
jgi:hypothetical protein